MPSPLICAIQALTRSSDWSGWLSYFTATAPLLYQDDSLLCVSAFNDNGQEKFATDPMALYRSDFFPVHSLAATTHPRPTVSPLWTVLAVCPKHVA